MTSEQIPALRLEGIVKTFPGVRALDGVSFTVNSGEVHALMGENGAGKSTLMKVLGGIYQPNEGQIFIEEQPTVMKSPLELPRKSFGRVDWSKLYADTGAILERLNVGFGPKDLVTDLSIANKQMAEIARALTVEAKAVIFDEPTASLTDAEKSVLFDVIEDLKSQGVGIVYISHRMEEIFRISDRVSVLRDGQYCGTVITSETNEDEVTKMMIGRSLDLSRDDMEEVKLGDVALEVRGLSCGKLYQDISFEVRDGAVDAALDLLLWARRRWTHGDRRNALRPARPHCRDDSAGWQGGEHRLAGRCDRGRYLASAGRSQGTGVGIEHELPRQHDPSAGR